MSSEPTQDNTPQQAAPAPSAEESITALEAALAEMRDKWMRAEAETQNLRARAAREVQEARAFAVQKFATDVVEVAENLRRGLAALPPAAEAEDPLLARLRGGFEGVEKAFWATLERNGIKRHEAEGTAFDPDLHQAMAEQPAPEGVAPGTVLQAWSAGWTLNGRLVRPAMVVVAAAAQEPAPDAA
ncbi:MAG: nucleotide exchange factor GrpE [Alphaproteobacteria bacterium]|nr:nucleotide exchange factor GrpE [Alphaproteobacteria bacterium]